MSEYVEDRRSKKIKLVDSLLALVFKSSYIRQRAEVIMERALIQFRGFHFSYISDENGELEFVGHVKNVLKGRSFTFFDVGAHHGTFTRMVLEDLPDYTGHLFEPTPESFKRLCENFNADEELTVNALALSNFIGMEKLIRYPDDPTRNGLVGVSKELSFTTEDIPCSVETGDQYCKDRKIKRIELLKIDAEGHDFFVIEGFDRLISDKAVGVIQFEYTFKHADVGVPLRKYFDFFRERGYLIGPIRKHGVEFYDEFDPRYNQYDLGPNYAAVRRDLVEDFKAFCT